MCNFILQGSEQLYINRVNGISTIVFVGQSTSITSPTSVNPTMDSDTPTDMIDIILVAVVVTTIGVSVVGGVIIGYGPLCTNLLC